jgi:hypothetical protein
MEFKVGQKWKDREDRVLEVTSIDNGGAYPVRCKGEEGVVRSFTLDGVFDRACLDGSYDLIELIEDPITITITPPPPADDDDDGWIEFSGYGPCPVGKNDTVSIQTQMGTFHGMPAGRLSWGRADSSFNKILRFKVTAKGLDEKHPAADDPTTHPLYPVFMAAINQAMHGKGKRHGGSETPFLEQPIFHYAKMHGRGFLTGQAAKKLEEAASTRTGEAFETEVLGALVYAAASILRERGAA